MKYDLQFAKKQVDDLHRLRVERVLQGSTADFQHVFQLIALLLHLNHPALPGYVTDAPAGVAHFKLSDYQKNFLAQQFPTGFDFVRLEQESNAHQQEKTPIYGVYVMGSIASISQTAKSDLDTWVCHSPDLTPYALNKLQQKTQLLKIWAKKFNTDITLFLMDEFYFNHYRYSNTLSVENCGSAQHMLLLDEFYRSAIRLAGKPLLWLHLNVENEADYGKEVQRLQQTKQINRADWIDFGGLGAFSANEYFGASLWQLYKGIDSPYKSVLKIVLLESYSQEYPNAKLISMQFKQQLFNLKPVKEQCFDAYLAMLERVTEYLTKLKDEKRLDFIRRCFYIKVTETVRERPLAPWRAKILKNLTAQWGWSEETIKHLNRIHTWKIRSVRETHNKLIRVLMLSYRNLVNFARKHNVNASIAPQDISILTRKLYTAFEVLPGKVTLMNPQLALDLSEKNLTFIEVTEEHGVKPGWYVVNQMPSVVYPSQNRYIEYNPILIKLIAWTYFNGLLTSKTKVHISSTHVDIEKLNQCITDLRVSFPVKVSPPTDEELTHPCEIRSLAVMINLTKDPTPYSDINRTEIQQSDLFSLDGENESLIGSVDLLYRNKWNEIKTLHYEGDKAMLSALKVLSNKIHRGSGVPESVNVFCYNQYYQEEISELVVGLLNKCISIQLGTTQLPMSSVPRMTGKNWKLFFEEHDATLHQPQTEPAFISQVIAEQKQVKVKRNQPYKHLLNYPRQIDSFASEGFLQFFFEDNEDETFNVYILDENNRLEIYRQCDGSKEQKIREISQIYNLSGSDQNDNHYKIIKRDFNYPQFYQLKHQQKGILILPFSGSCMV
ncbi:class I adenylate cyclase [Basfia succiniciproducens]|uniref:class I adenylate cyclase n=1 Tax=Basfia succiniciproducens TaxID=653940 RepID=UPI003FCCEFBA